MNGVNVEVTAARLTTYISMTDFCSQNNIKKASNSQHIPRITPLPNIPMLLTLTVSNWRCDEWLFGFVSQLDSRTNENFDF